ncbi:MAG TPA: hypothetical protein VNI52_11700 [Sphingobacteriaceae bacterium]|nr:hypothetical protein [Sphingobacteriaceae bacterium]
MKTYLLLLIACFLCLLACNKKTGNTSEQQLRAENFKLKQENDSLKQLLTKTDTTSLKTDTVSQITTLPPVSSNYPKIPGKHALTLQWISWDVPGSVNITEAEDGWYKITGQQIDKKNSENYLRINGKIKPVNASELEFEGTIESKITTINSGKPCVRTGRKIFKATGTRKYWRLQDMINCEGGMLTDYIDIYF